MGGNLLLHVAANLAGIYSKSFMDLEQRKVFLETCKSMITLSKTRRDSDKQWELFQSGERF